MKSFKSNDEVSILSGFDNKSNEQTEHSSAHLYEIVIIIY